MSEQPEDRDYPAEPYDRLLYHAEADLQAAEAVLNLPDPFWHEPCFLARESAEKAFKAFIEAAGRAAPELHGLPPYAGPALRLTRASCGSHGTRRR